MWQKKIVKKSPDDHRYLRDENLFYQALMSTSISIIHNKSFFDFERVASFSDKTLQWFKQLVHKIERDGLVSWDQWMMEHQQRRFYVLVDIPIRSNNKEKKNSSDDQWNKFTGSTALSLNLRWSCQSSNRCWLLKKRIWFEAKISILLWWNISNYWTISKQIFWKSVKQNCQSIDALDERCGIFGCDSLTTNRTIEFEYIINMVLFCVHCTCFSTAKSKKNFVWRNWIFIISSIR